MTLRHFLLSVSVLFLVSCASAGQNPGDSSDVYDPLEGLNRATFEFNYFIDGLLIKPVALMYRDLPPPAVRESVDNFLINLESPVNFANTVLQGDMNQAGNTFMRFLINSTFGVAGLFDVATGWGFPYRQEDFGQTLASWGTGEGGYLVLPILGPSNLRDAAGRVADFFMDPLRYVLLVKNDEEELYMGRAVMTGVSTRARTIAPLDDIEANSLDYYASLRSLYKQRRDYLIDNKGSRAPGEEPLPPQKNKAVKADEKPVKKQKGAVNLPQSQDGALILSQQDLPYYPPKPSAMP